MGSESDSDISSDNRSVSRHAHKRRSIYGKYKRLCRFKSPRWSFLEVNAISFGDAADQSGSVIPRSHVQLQPESHSEGTSAAPSLAKGKYDDLSKHDKLVTNNGNGADSHAQFEFDRRLTVELEQRLNDEFRRNRRLEKKNKEMKKELQTLKVKVKANDERRGTSQSTSTVRKSQTPFGIGSSSNFSRASSRVPVKSGLVCALQGYNDDGGQEPSYGSSSSSSSTGLLPHGRNRMGDGNRVRSSESSGSENIFRPEPESDRSSDSERPREAA
jgi:hypothetical protein